MKLFDEKFVRFMWDDELEGKVCFVAGKMGRHYLGCELRKEFFDKAKARLDKVGFQKSLFE